MTNELLIRDPDSPHRTLVLRLDPKLDITIIRNFLLRIRFAQVDDEFITHTVNYRTIARIIRYFTNLGLSLELDNNCQRIIQEFENERQRFGTMWTSAEAIKEDREDAQHWWVDIPRFRANEIAETSCPSFKA